MRKIVLVSMFLLCLAGLASADVLMTAGPLGQGKWNLTAGAKLDSNYFDMGGLDQLFIDTVRYGINDNLEIYALTNLGYSEKATGKPRTMDAMTMFGGGLGIKYVLLKEEPLRPAVAVNLMVKGTTQSKASMCNNQYSFGLMATKRATELINPYCAVNYRETKQDYGDFSQYDVTVGTGIGPDNQMLMLEGTVQWITFAGATFNSSQLALGYSINLN